MAIDVTKRRADRLRVLAAMFDATGGVEREPVRLVPTLQAQVGLSDEDFQAACAFLVGERLISAVYAVSNLYVSGQLTHRGVVEMEASLGAPDKPTRYLPPAISIVNISNSTLVDSPVQNGSADGQQTVKRATQEENP